MPASPTQRTLLYLRKRGAIAESVERYIKTPVGGFRRDLFHFCDILAVDDQPGVLFIQACRTADMATRETKMRSEKCWPAIQRVLAAKNRVVLIGWAKRGLHSKRWTMREVEIAG